MSKPLKALFAFVILVFLGSVIAVLAGYFREPGQMAEVVQDGQVIYTFDLRRDKNQSVRVDWKDGGYNIITIQDGTIFMSEADCPDQTCVKMGTLKAENVPIVCLPHRLVIRLSYEEAE